MAYSVRKKMKDIPGKGGEFGVILESIDSNVKHIAEAADLHTKQIGDLQKDVEGISNKLNKMDDRLVAIETTLESVNLPMWKEKLLALEKRVSALESKRDIRMA